jgi:hypothetical protein
MTPLSRSLNAHAVEKRWRVRPHGASPTLPTPPALAGEADGVKGEGRRIITY